MISIYENLHIVQSVTGFICIGSFNGLDCLIKRAPEGTEPVPHLTPLAAEVHSQKVPTRLMPRMLDVHLLRSHVDG